MTKKEPTEESVSAALKAAQKKAAQKKARFKPPEADWNQLTPGQRARREARGKG